MSQDYLDKLIEKDETGTQIQSIPLHDTELRGITIDEPITVEGNPINFSTKNEQNAIQTIVDLEPIQDLHGYDKPWVGGAGKNLIDMTAWTDVSSVTHTVEGNKITITATNRQYACVNIGGNESLKFTPGTYYVKCKCNSISTETGYIRFALRGSDNGVRDFVKITTGNVSGSMTISENCYFSILVTGSTTVSNTVVIEDIILSTVDVPFEPYENICPITPHEEIKIGGCGINIWDEEWELKAFDTTSHVWFSANRISSKNYISVNPNTDYYFKAPKGSIIVFYNVSKNYLSHITRSNGTPSGIITTPDNCKYLLFQMYNEYGTTTYNNDISINSDFTDTSYHAYTQSNSLTLPLPEDIYGGTLNLETGELVVDRKYISDLSSLYWNYSSGYGGIFYAPINDAKYSGDGKLIGYDCYCSQYASAGDKTWNHFDNGDINVGSDTSGGHKPHVNIKDNRYSDAATFKNAMLDVQLVYPLATPYTLHLTPAQLKLFKDVNNLNSSDYTTLTVTYHSNSIATLAPATDIADGLLTAMDKRALDRTEEIIEGNPIAFETESVQVAKSTIVDLEPIQDLHGYTKPWVGGAGKNKLPLTLAKLQSDNTNGTWTNNTYALNGVIWTINKDIDSNVISIKAHGLASADSQLNVTGISSVLTAGLGVTYNGCPANGSASSYQAFIRGGGYDRGNGNNITPTQENIDNDYYWYRIMVASGYNAQNLMFYPMIRLSTVTDATFEPYTNIAAISGRSEVDILGCGKNLFNPELFEQGLLDNLTGELVTTGIGTKWISSNFIKVSESINISGYKDGTEDNWCVRFCEYDEHKNFIVNTININTQSVTSYNKTISLNSNTKYIRASFGFADKTTTVEAFFATNRVQLIKGNISSAYTPYTPSNNISIQLGETVYGGTLDVEKGELVVDMKYDTLPTNNWSKRSDSSSYMRSNIFSDIKLVSGYSTIANIYCDIAKAAKPSRIVDPTVNENGIGIGDGDNKYCYMRIGDDYDTLEKFVTYITNNPVGVCYELSTPTTISLTPEQVKLLSGVNTITTNADKITLTYRNGSVATLNDLESLYNKLKAYIDSLHSS